ncbi:MAG: hypothetical protein M3Y88_09275 [Chloroflexota bacterium]|nr:hypothetical protein [Chloroflexota bacterium]
MSNSALRLSGLVAIAATLAACSGSPAGAASASSSASSSAAASSSTAASSSASASASTAASAFALEAKQVGSQGTILVAGSNGMTVYTFAKDVPNSGKSNCTGGCLATWPALTVSSASGATGSSAVTGKIATITRSDDSSLQVTYNGLPLYFFKNDRAPGDANGVYTNWMIVKP